MCILQQYMEAYKRTVSSGEAMCVAEPGMRADLVSDLAAITANSSALLLATRTAAANPAMPQAKTNLSGAAKDVKDALDGLLAKVWMEVGVSRCVCVFWCWGVSSGRARWPSPKCIWRETCLGRLQDCLSRLSVVVPKKRPSFLTLWSDACAV